MPVISIILPFFNRIRYLQDSIESIFYQDFKDFEIIAVDDGSTDGSAQLVKKLNKIPIRLISQKNQGASCARNVGVRAASGRFLTFLDSDDIWVPNKLSAQLVDIHNNSNDTLCFGHIQEFISPELLGSKNKIQTRLLPGLSLSTLFMLREDFLRIGELNPAFKLAEFIEWFERSKHKGFSTYVSNSIYAYRRIHQGNIGKVKSSNAKQYLQAIKSSLDLRRLLD